MKALDPTLPSGAIAVIGLACRFPGANSPDQFWRNLRAGTESITFFTADELAAAGIDRALIDDPAYVPAKGVLAGADCFDAGFFGYSPREAALIDPQQRVFLECAWSALEDAAYVPHDYRGAIGVFAGGILSTYLLQNVWPNRAAVEAAGVFQTALGNDPTFLSTRASYLFDLRGPSVSVGTACSTALMAVHLACQSLLAHESDMALAGGVSIHLPLTGGYRYENGGILSPDGHCRPFDAEARGTVSSDGVGVVMLKRLEDALADGDCIRAVIRGTAANNDGSAKVGFTAPSVASQARVIAEALAMAGVEPETLSMIEAHAAGTLLGDPIEVAALAEAFAGCGGGEKFCALGSVKSNIGHVDAAAGIAGLIKTVLALQHREIPASLHFQTANAQIALKDTPFYVNSQLRSFGPGAGPMRAGVSSFGIGGTNVHVVLEQPPLATRDEDTARPFELLALSARSPAALDAAAGQLADHIEQNPILDLTDVSRTLLRGRRAFEYRSIAVCRDRAETIATLRARDPQHLISGQAPSARPAVAFMFPGLGDHYPGMGWEFYCAEPEFRRTIDQCAELLRGHLDGDIRDFLYPGRDWAKPVLDNNAASNGAGAANLDLRAMLARARETDKCRATQDRPDIAQPSIFVTEMALALLLRSWGIEPEALIGYSIGEFTAACVSGVFSLADALTIVAARARLIQTQVRPGAMLAVPAGEAELTPLLPGGVALAAVNAAALSVASGEAAGITELERRLTERGVSARRLNSTHAYHSPMMEAIVAPLLAVLARVPLQPPRIPYVSCLTGTWITPAQATDPHYWAEHLCRTVRFDQGVSELLSDPNRVLLEVGPGQSLTSHAIAARARLPGHLNPAIPTMRWSYGRQPEYAVLMRGVGLLWLAGAAIDMARFAPGKRRVPLPTYPFERQRYWIDPPARGEAAVAAMAGAKNPDVADWFYLPYWKPSMPAANLAGGKIDGLWLLFVDDCGVGSALAEALAQRGANVVSVLPGAAFHNDGDAYTIDPRRAEDYRALIRDLRQRHGAPKRIVHLWSLTRGDERPAPSSAGFDEQQTSGYHSVMRLMQALSGESCADDTRIEIVTNRLYEVTGDEVLAPEKATLLGPAMVAPQEHPGLVCRCLDIDIAPHDAPRSAALVAQLMAELGGAGTEASVAFRHGRRWVQAYEQVRLDRQSEVAALRQRGVYLLTGGLGGVGLVLASHLAHAVQARLVLVGRSAFPERALWDRWIAEHAPGDPTGAKIRQLLALEAAGAEVLVLCADVSDAGAMRRVLAAVDARFGALHGVIHGAGSVGLQAFREINQSTPADAEAQFAAKVHGVLVLNEVLGSLPIDFCLLTSSLSAVLGGLGFAAYSAGNLFMDAFARWKNRAGVTPWISVNWDSWRLSDVKPVIAGLGATVSQFTMEPDEGAEAFERILSHGARGQIVVSSGDLHGRLRQWIERGGKANAPVVKGEAHARPHLRTLYAAPRGQLELALAEIWHDLFNVEPIGVNDNFFELGGHSLLATQLNARISARLQVEMSLATLLQAPTIAELALLIVGTQATKTDPEMLERMLSEVGELSGGDIAGVLAGIGRAQPEAVGHE
jgi:phthiocerol/phenolphthiocerol synthesis type-I polyketide synthase E